MSQFDDLPKIDPKDFEPPAWATSSRFHWDKGEGSSSSGPSYYQTPDSSLGQNADEYDGLDETLVDTDLGIQKVKEDLGGEAVYEFTTEELKVCTVSRKAHEQKLSSKALKLKELGNKAFTSKTPHLEKALDSYTAALEFLPSCPKRSDKIETAPKEPSSGIIEVTDEEADTMREEEAKKAQRTPEDTEREDVEEAIRSCTAACWSNIAAVHAKVCSRPMLLLRLQRGDDAKAVAACDEALKIDPHHTRALTRRADANERIGTTSSLGKAQTGKEIVEKKVDKKII